MAVRGKRNLRNLSDADSAEKEVPDNLPIIGLRFLTILAFSDLLFCFYLENSRKSMLTETEIVVLLLLFPGKNNHGF